MSCLSLSGSTLCPSFQNLFINPTNLSTAWPFFSNVTDVASFDASFANYIAPGGQFAVTKQQNQLGCTNFAAVGQVLQWSQTFLCGEFTGISYSASCNANITDTMTCQKTCIEFANSEQDLVNNTVACPTAGSTRAATLTKDFTQCTSWTTLATNNSATCVLGEVNEPNCGFGSSTSQLCNFCNPSGGRLVDACCIGGRTNTTASCGFAVSAAQVIVSSSSSSIMPSSTSSSVAPSSTAASATPTSSTPSSSASAGGANAGTSTSSSHKLSGGAIAGIVIGVLAFLALLAILLFFLCRRRRHGAASSRDSPEMTLAGTPSTYLKEKKSSPVSTFATTPMEPSKSFGGSSYTSPALLPSAAAIGAASFASNSRPISGATQLTNITQTTSSSGNDGRVLIDSFQDLYSPAQITPESQVEAIYAYNPTLSDELQLSPGDSVLVHKLFDDNWANGTIEDADGTTRNGAFPLVCVTAARGNDSSTSRGSMDASAYQTDNEAYQSAHSEAGGETSEDYQTAGTEFAPPASTVTSTPAGYVKEIFPRRR